MKLDILTTTAGNLPYVRKCIETTLPGMPGGSRLLIRDNPQSRHDGTDVYLRQLARDNENVTLYQPEWAGEHGHNMDFLLAKTHADWALVIDSDIEFTNPNWAAVLEAQISAEPSMRLLVEIGTRNVDPNDRNILPGGQMVTRRWVPRATTYFFLVNVAWFRSRGVSCGRSDFHVKRIFQDSFRYPNPRYLGETPDDRWTMENGWQLLWVGANENEDAPFTMVQLPRVVFETFVHHRHKICGNLHAKGQMAKLSDWHNHWGEDIEPFRP